ncbi:MAG TPA: hypothetical protein DCZ75_00435 [Geobacter sp.]|nr:hypothetical protein [Geobacter sp.]
MASIDSHKNERIPGSANGRISVSDVEPLQETEYLLSSTENKRRLFESVAQVEYGKVKEKDLID